MNALIGDRFLKQFFGRRLSRQMANPAGESPNLLENTAETPAGQGCPTGEGKLKEKAMSENDEAGEIDQVQNAKTDRNQPLHKELQARGE
jgi:hypothetical protein